MIATRRVLVEILDLASILTRLSGKQQRPLPQATLPIMAEHPENADGNRQQIDQRDGQYLRRVLQQKARQAGPGCHDSEPPRLRIRLAHDHARLTAIVIHAYVVGAEPQELLADARLSPIARSHGLPRIRPGGRERLPERYAFDIRKQPAALSVYQQRLGMIGLHGLREARCNANQSRAKNTTPSRTPLSSNTGVTISMTAVLVPSPLLFAPGCGGDM